MTRAYCSLLFLFVVLMMPLAAFAAKPPLPEDKKQALSKLEQQVEDEKAHQAALQTQADKLADDMKDLKSNLIGTTKSVQEQERNLQIIEKKLSDLQTQKNDLLANLDKQRSSLANLLLALERIRRLPPEALIARPDAPLQTAQAATVMGSILPEINKRSAQLKTNLEDLTIIENDLTEQKSDLEKTSQKLKTDKSKMDTLLKERSQALKATKKQVASKSVEIASLTKETKDFRDLIKQLEEKNKEIDDRTGNAGYLKKSDLPHEDRLGNDAAFSDASLGTGRLPVSGIIKTHYGEADDIGATSKGIVFSARPGSVVVAPLGGIIRYAGTFRNYGQIVLIEHKNKFHSLVAGLGKVDTFEGQRVDAGEPLGYLPDDSGRLYYELRYQGDPVNPSKKFSKLN